MSLRVRLLLASLAVALVALVLADIATYRALRSFLVDRTDDALEAVHADIERAVLSGNPVNADAIAVIAPGVYVQVRDASGRVTIDERPGRQGEDVAIPDLPADVGAVPASDGPGEPHRFFTVGAADGDGDDFRVRAARLDGGQTLLLALGLEEAERTLDRLVAIEVVVTAAALLAAAAIGWWLVRLGLRPLRAVQRTADSITAGQLDQRVPGDDRHTEVGHVALALNTMLGRIQDSFAERDRVETELRAADERLRQFVADASHELRTPIAAVSAYAELFERGGADHPEDVPKAMAGIRRETDRMSHLVDDLLLLARLDEGLPLERRAVELVAMAAESIDAARAVAPGWPVELTADRPHEVLGDEVRLRQVVDNLLANVRAHTPTGTPATVGIRQDGDAVVLTVADRGPGMAPAQAEHAFERFYRADSSRARSRGGTGLGLAIVASIAHAHGGTAELQASPGAGTTVSIRLPASG